MSSTRSHSWCDVLLWKTEEPEIASDGDSSTGSGSVSQMRINGVVVAVVVVVVVVVASVVAVVVVVEAVVGISTVAIYRLNKDQKSYVHLR